MRGTKKDRICCSTFLRLLKIDIMPQRGQGHWIFFREPKNRNGQMSQFVILAIRYYFVQKPGRFQGVLRRCLLAKMSRSYCCSAVGKKPFLVNSLIL